MLPQQNRLTEKRDFERLRQQGRKIPSLFFTFIFFKRNDGLPSRFGFIITNKLSPKATQRNRIKRLFRESVYSFLPQIDTGYDGLFVAKDKTKDADFGILKTEVEIILRQAGISGFK